MLGASEELLLVNAASPKQKAAVRFVSFCATHLDPTTQYMLYPDMNAPYPNPGYETRLNTLRKERENLEKRLAIVGASQIPMLQDEIAQKESIIKSISDNRWLISPESIRTYRSIAEKLRVPYAFDYLSEGESGGYNATASVIAQSCSDGLDQSKIDSFVKTLDQDTYLVYMEGQ